MKTIATPPDRNFIIQSIGVDKCAKPKLLLQGRWLLDWGFRRNEQVTLRDHGPGLWIHDRLSPGTDIPYLGSLKICCSNVNRVPSLLLRGKRLERLGWGAGAHVVVRYVQHGVISIEKLVPVHKNAEERL